MGTPRQNLIARLALLVGAVCLLLQMRAVVRSTTDAGATEPAVLEYLGEWRPDSHHHRPGDDVFFQVGRRSMLRGRDPLPILIFSSFQNMESSVTYALPPVPHIVETDGDRTITTVRQLPREMKPGRYRLIGWAETHTAKRQCYAVFTSQPIDVQSDFTAKVP